MVTLGPLVILNLIFAHNLARLFIEIYGVMVLCLI